MISFALILTATCVALCIAFPLQDVDKKMAAKKSANVGTVEVSVESLKDENEKALEKLDYVDEVEVLPVEKKDFTNSGDYAAVERRIRRKRETIIVVGCPENYAYLPGTSTCVSCDSVVGYLAGCPYEDYDE